MITIPDHPTEVDQVRNLVGKVENTRAIVSYQDEAPHHEWPRMGLVWQPVWPTGWSLEA